MQNKNNECREFTLYSDIHHEVIIYQVELLRVINILNTRGSFNLANKLKKIIYFSDLREGTKTDMKANLSREDPTKYMMSPKDRSEYFSKIKQIDDEMEVFYYDS